MATLRGHAISTLWGLADHTYVTCAAGYAWPCWGRSAGGSIICAGAGSSAKANCLSWPGSTAGLVYGVTGVCHQTANRILWPAGVTVHRAKGYWASVLAYGVYGTDTVAWLARLAACSGTSGEIPECLPRAAGAVKRSQKASADEMIKLPGDAKDRALVKRIGALYQKGVTPLEHKRRLTLKGAVDYKTLAGETKLVMQSNLGSTVKAAQIKDIQAIQMDLFGMKDELGQRLHAGSIGGEELAMKVNAAVNKALKSCLKSLGKEAYSKMFELEPGEEMNVVDPKIAIQTHK